MHPNKKKKVESFYFLECANERWEFPVVVFYLEMAGDLESGDENEEFGEIWEI